MRVSRPFYRVFLVLAAFACDNGTSDRERAQLAASLGDSLGVAVDPQVAFLNHSKHLLIHLDAKAFGHSPDSALTRKALNIARFAVQRYAGPPVDSVTVEGREIVIPNQTMLIKWSRAFSRSQLRENGS
jgi:hypothetical protein